MSRDDPARAGTMRALFVVSSDERIRHEYLNDVFMADANVEVVLDRRRAAERRRGGASPTLDRRQAERRVHSVTGDLEAFGWALVWRPSAGAEC